MAEFESESIFMPGPGFFSVGGIFFPDQIPLLAKDLFLLETALVMCVFSGIDPFHLGFPTSWYKLFMDSFTILLIPMKSVLSLFHS